jgi:hypothetical protein
VLGSIKAKPMSTFTLEQKKLEQLRKQLYGKQELTPVKKSAKKAKTDTAKETTTPLKQSYTSSYGSLTDTHIKKDLTKVVFITGIALIFQYLLYTAIINNWLRLGSYGITF